MNEIRKAIVILFFHLLLLNSSFCQSGKFGQYFHAGIELGYFNTIEDIGYRYHEFTGSLKVGMNLYRSLFAGVQVNLMETNSNWNGSNTYFIKDFYLQYDILPKHSLRVLLETSISEGNYCTCEKFEPYSSKGVIYLGYGIGVAYPIKKTNFHVSSTFKLHTLLNRPQPKTNYNLMKVGVYYLFGKSNL